MIKPIAVCHLRVSYRHRLIVNIWPTKKSMLSYANSQKNGRLGKSTEAFFRNPRIRVHVFRNGRVLVINRIVGEINLVVNRFGAGIFAHELQHFLQSWYINTNMDLLGADWEPAAYLAGDLTRDFWVWFYKHFENK